MGSVAVKEKPQAAKPEGVLRVIKGSGFVAEWQVHEGKAGAKPMGNDEKPNAGAQVSNPFVREKKEEQPAQLPSDNYFG